MKKKTFDKIEKIPVIGEIIADSLSPHIPTHYYKDGVDDLVTKIYKEKYSDQALTRFLYEDILSGKADKKHNKIHRKHKLNS